jgi:hypothetical protein
MNIKYCFRSDACIRNMKDIDADAAALELARIHDENGLLTPDGVLEEAKDESNPLHPAFEWDDAVAGKRWRRKQAQELIYSVRVICDNEKPEPVYIHSASCGGYKLAEEVVQRIDLYEEAYRKALTRIGEAEHSLRQLEELSMKYRPEATKSITKAANAMVQLAKIMPQVK